VTAAQSAASVAGLAAYDADAGIKDVYFGLTTNVPLSDVWTLKLSGRYSRLVGDASDSPIVEDENQFFGGLGLSYRFNVR
jgi:outer membrane protein